MTATAYLMHGKTLHQRIGAIKNRFVYPVLYIRIDLMQPLIGHTLFGHNRFRLLSFFDRDHGDGHTPLLAWFQQKITQAGVADGWTLARLELTTQPRVLGFVFNPVSFWAAYDANDHLRVVLCEVNNTFGVRLSYLLTAPQLAPIESKTVLTAYKQLHVSPFYPVTGAYRFRFDLQAQQQHVLIEYFEHGLPTDAATTPADLTTTLQVNGQVLNRQNALHSLARYGWSTAMVVIRIHWQALRLWRKGVRFYRSPPKPSKDIHHESTR